MKRFLCKDLPSQLLSSSGGLRTNITIGKESQTIQWDEGENLEPGTTLTMDESWDPTFR
jgi:hypothetical protein